MSGNRLKRWIKWILAAAAFFAAADVSLLRLLASRRAHKYLEARLAEQFGREVEVRRFSVQWLPAPGIVANQVTIAEDPRFGNEYFLRAESVVASPRWGALVAGRLEVGTIHFSQPSLNLVRNADGKWNVESWLPPAAARGASVGNASPGVPRATAKLFRIEIDGGRINFNQGVNRRPFALVDLTGSIEQESPGAWNVALAARPQRATVRLQNSGTIRLAGHIAGTSARLQPAELVLTWNDVSLADALRLAMGRDPGVRGEAQMQLKARTAPVLKDSTPNPAQWSFSFSAQLDGLHRWDMASRGDNPALNIQAEAAWKVGAPDAELSRLLVQAPRSKIEGTGSVDWSHGIQPEVKLASSGVAFNDLFAWYKSFQPGVAEEVSASGFLTGKAELRGWPVRVESAAVKSLHAAFSNGNTSLLEFVKLEGFAEQGSGSAGATIWFPPGKAPTGIPTSASSKSLSGLPHEWLTVSASFAKQGRDELGSNKFTGMHLRLDLDAAMEQGERMLAASRALGRPLNNSWDAKGGVDGHLQWQWNAGEKFPRASGEMTVQAVTLQLPVFNQPLEIAKAKVELEPEGRRVTIAEASGLGARWQGTIWRRERPIPGGHLIKTAGNSAMPEADAQGDWEFDLAADRLDATELDRWIGPRSRPGWLARFFLQAKTAPSQIMISGPVGQIHARGNLRAEVFALASLEIQKLRAKVELSGHSLDVSQFEAKAYGGSIEGKMRADLGADPDYLLRAAVSKVSAAELAAANPTLDGRVSGQLSGEIHLSMHGVGREHLLNSLEAEGRISASQSIIRGVSFSGAADEPDRSETQAPFSLVDGEFSIDARRFKFTRMSVLAGKRRLEGSGTAGFDRSMQFEFEERQLAPAMTVVNERPANRATRITGLLEAPHVTTEVMPVRALKAAPQPTTQPFPQSEPRMSRPSLRKATPSPISKSTPSQSSPQSAPQPVAHIARH